MLKYFERKYDFRVMETRLIVWLFAVVIISGAVAASHAENFDKLLDNTKFKKLMLDSNGMLMVIDGVLLSQEGVPVADKRVKIFCKHEDRVRRIFTVITDESGHFFTYKLNMQNWRCDVGDTVWGVYTASPPHETQPFIVQAQVQNNIPYIGLASSSVPEFSTITAMLAITGVLAGLIILRK